MKNLLFLYLMISSNFLIGQNDSNADRIICGAERITAYLPSLEGKKVAVVANHTSMIGEVHLVDSLITLGVDLVKIFSPEHGFRGKADAGEHLHDEKDEKTGLPIISLYGKHYKPTTEDLVGVDVLLFDIQDVGVRFYTYISTMHYVLEACAENQISVIILDRPNPNGFYVDGPVLQKKYKSFVGMHPVPIVHGMTIAEYAYMINQEGWLKDHIKCELSFVLCRNYDHSSRYELPIKPSPNLQSMRSIYLYPSLGIFEGTLISVGRGTDFPFEVFGHPDMENMDFSFVPRSIRGVSKNPKYKGEKCYGRDLSEIPDSLVGGKFDLSYIFEAYQNIENKSLFFNAFFYNLVGNDKLIKQIRENESVEAIKISWEKEIQQYLETRSKYLLYRDFE